MHYLSQCQTQTHLCWMTRWWWPASILHCEWMHCVAWLQTYSERIIPQQRIHPSMEHMNVAWAAPSLDTWHRRLGHVNYPSIIWMADKKLAKGIPTSLDFLLQTCKHCVLAKQAKALVPNMQERGRAKRLLEIFFLDIAGPEDIQTPNGKMHPYLNTQR